MQATHPVVRAVLRDHKAVLQNGHTVSMKWEHINGCNIFFPIVRSFRHMEINSRYCNS